MDWNASSGAPIKKTRKKETATWTPAVFRMYINTGTGGIHPDRKKQKQGREVGSGKAGRVSPIRFGSIVS